MQPPQPIALNLQLIIMSDLSIPSAETFEVVHNHEQNDCYSIKVRIQPAKRSITEYMGKHHKKILHLMTVSLKHHFTDYHWNNVSYGITIMVILPGTAGDL